MAMSNQPSETNIHKLHKDHETSLSVRSVKVSRKSRKSASAFRTISEVAEELDVQQHVLRFWETKFTHVKPLKRGGGRRYYRPEDVELLKTIHKLLYTDGYTIKGVQKLLKGHGKKQIIEGEIVTEIQPEGQSANDVSKTAQSGAIQSNVTVEEDQNEDSEVKISGKQKAILEAMLGDLKELRDMIKSS